MSIKINKDATGHPHYKYSGKNKYREFCLRIK